TPKPVQQTIRNFFGNIEDAFSALTALMSGKLDRAGNDMGRVIVNTLFGIGGLIDVASDGGIPKGDWDFGLAFGTWGFQQGPYLFVPLIGPTTVRDGTGLAIRVYLGPVGYLPDVPTRNVLYGIGALDLRAQALSAESVIDQAALDRYTFIRRAYLQRRQYLDRKSTRLNSSHVSISYAVFCLKKKKKKYTTKSKTNKTKQKRISYRSLNNKINKI